MKCCLGLLTLELFFESSHSLKERRSILLSAKEKIRQRFNVSVVEASMGDLWQRGGLLISCAASTQGAVEQIFGQVISFLENDPRLQIVSPQIRYYE